MKYLQQLPTPEEVLSASPLSSEQTRLRDEVIASIKSVLGGVSNRKVILVGPCSADREDAVLEYMDRLAALNEKIKDRFVIIPRVYTGKPRTNGLGYKGLIHRPIASETHDDIVDGIAAMRRMHLRVIQNTGLFTVDEMLYPDTLPYIQDLLAYVAIGARSVENQEHRLVASGLNVPVGMKNPTSGDLGILMNALTCAQRPQSLVYRGWAVETEGNPYAHAIIRGYNDKFGVMHSNYHYEDICDLHDTYCQCNLMNMSVVVDCNHANSRKHYEEQGRIATSVMTMCAKSSAMNAFVKGVMIESYLMDGKQMVDEGIYGKSITDGCLGWDKTERLLLNLCDIL